MKSCVLRKSAPLLALAVLGTLMAAPPLSAGGPFKEADVKKIAVDVTKAAHPTGKNATLLKFSESNKEGVLHLKMQVEYRGAISNNRYTADVLVQVRLPKKLGDPLEVTGIDFVDNNNSVRPNQNNLRRLTGDMNARFRIDAAK
jgi:hypothetical protein